jgi:hypothetical protein
MAVCLEKLGISVSGERVPVDAVTSQQISLACVSSDEDSESSDSDDDEKNVAQDGFSEPTSGERFTADKTSPKTCSDHNCDISTSSITQSKSDCVFSEMNLLHTLISSLPSFVCLSDQTSGYSDVGVDRVNLDITTLITLVSSVTHGGCHFEFSEKILAQQAAEERREAVLPKLTKFLQGNQIAIDPAV